MPAPTASIEVSEFAPWRASRSGFEITTDHAAAANALARKRCSGSWRSRYPISERTWAAAIASTPQLCEDAGVAKVKPVDRMPELVEQLLVELGEDTRRQGLRATPDRVSRALRELTDGYGVQPADVIAGAIFEQDYDEMVLVKDIPFYSLCEHHMLPFFGSCHVGYLPKGRVVGLSKIPRLVGVFAHRLQLQERLTTEIAEALNEQLTPRGVGVVVEARHLCMEMRGVQKPGGQLITSCMLGTFRKDARTRAEFLDLVRRP
jgi:GTP cyclohydrolase I